MKLIGYLWSLLLILLGATLLGWIAYNSLIEEQPAAEGRNPVVPLAFGAAFLVTGIWRLRRTRKGA